MNQLALLTELVIKITEWELILLYLVPKAVLSSSIVEDRIQMSNLIPQKPIYKS